MTEKKPDFNLLRPATKEDVQEILLDIKKAYENRIKLFEKETKKIDDIFKKKLHENENLINYMQKVFETQKDNLLDETDLGSLFNLFQETFEPKLKR